MFRPRPRRSFEFADVREAIECFQDIALTIQNSSEDFVELQDDDQTVMELRDSSLKLFDERVVADFVMIWNAIQHRGRMAAEAVLMLDDLTNPRVLDPIPNVHLWTDSVEFATRMLKSRAAPRKGMITFYLDHLPESFGRTLFQYPSVSAHWPDDFYAWIRGDPDVDATLWG